MSEDIIERAWRWSCDPMAPEPCRDIANALLARDAEVRRHVEDKRRDGWQQCDIPACNCGWWHDVGNQAKRAEVQRDREASAEAFEALSDQWDRLRARHQRLREAVATGMELIDELRVYCRESWDWKYGERWDEDAEKVRAALGADKDGAT